MVVGPGERGQVELDGDHAARTVIAESHSTTARPIPRPPPVTTYERATCLVRQKPRTRVRWMRTGTEYASANFTASPNRAPISSPYFSIHAGLSGTAG